MAVVQLADGRKLYCRRPSAIKKISIITLGTINSYIRDNRGILIEKAVVSRCSKSFDMDMCLIFVCIFGLKRE